MLSQRRLGTVESRPMIHSHCGSRLLQSDVVLLPISWAKDLRIELFLLEAAWALAACAGLFQPQAKRPPPAPIPGNTSE
jgi:hypothetical protein